MKIRFGITVVISAVALIALSACNTKASSTPDAVKLQGAGASFPAPLYSKWFKQYSNDHKNVVVDYQSVGSGSGIKSVLDRTVDFGASDAAMRQEEMDRVQGGVQLFPMTAGSVVIAYNLKSVENLKLSRKAYAGIFLGTVKRWNAPEIASTNPGTSLPDLPINVVVRADGSGTSFVFSKHLSAINSEFEKTVGANTMPNWPVGTKSKGNEGVTAAIMTTPGSLGYVEYGYAKSQKIPMATLENKAGKYVSPTTASAQAALASTQLPENMIVWASDPDAAEAYPIVTYTWLICYKKYPDKRKQQAMQDLVKYGLTEGQKDAEALGYVPLPQQVVARASSAIQNITSD